jgi:hypothetical protein
MDKEDIFPPTGLYHSQQFYCSCLLWFKIITPSIQTDFGIRVPQLQTARHEHQAPSTSQLKDLTQDTANTCLWEEREFGAMCVPLKTKNQKQNSGVHNATWGLCYPMF